MKTDKLILYGAIAVVAYVVWSKLTKTGQAAVNTAGQVGANLWLTLFPLPAAMQVLGNVVMPNGSLIPVGSVQLRQDSDGNTFTQIAGTTYQLSPHDDQGNYPLTAVG